MLPHKRTEEDNPLGEQTLGANPCNAKPEDEDKRNGTTARQALRYSTCREEEATDEGTDNKGDATAVEGEETP
jgi:hypothetical protein